MTWAQRTVTLPILIHRAHQDKLEAKAKMAPRVLHAIEEGVWTDRYYLARAQVRSGLPRRPRRSVVSGGGNWAAEGQKGEGDGLLTFQCV